MHCREKVIPPVTGIAMTSFNIDAKEIERFGMYEGMTVAGAWHLLVNVSSVYP
jgi:hypothetical protein